MDVSRGALTPTQIRTLLAAPVAAPKKSGKQRATGRKSEPGKLARWFWNQLLRNRLPGGRERALPVARSARPSGA